MSYLDLTKKLNDTIDKITIKNLEEALKKSNEEKKKQDEKFDVIFEKIKEKVKDFACVEDFVYDYYDKPDYEFLRDVKYVGTMRGGEDHRWYVVGNNVYSIDVDGETYFFGALEVTMLKSEGMSWEDTYWKTKIFKVKRIIREEFEKDE